MAGAAAQQAFIFLDFPTELRLMVYEQIDITTIRHTLNRSDAGLEADVAFGWLVPPHETLTDSSITCIRPTLSVGILSTCHLINQEAKPIIERKLATLKLEPIRYLTDWSSGFGLEVVRSVQ
ncbi:hypothetical protein CC86DRAFT_409072 [Ophiobolus disseminans]|uniref:Uncharacterized protein n=1 Tax=Ophiobolus disseminans TaxID=1469910 RepID=A0A6A6ZT99_9PLEO|nr:hypothetical protein CC86DRAFT_409072 [Ophiobolus disseminans]